ncbi:hypothetical protein LCGC14_2895890, partial [marine sediment metagenome]
MKYEVALNSETMSMKYAKVPSRRGQVVITHRKTNVPKELFEKLMITQPTNFLFYI